MTRATAGAAQKRDMRRCEHRILGREVVGPCQCGEAAMALGALAAGDAGVHHGVSCERGVGRYRDVTYRAGLIRRIRHVTGRQSGGGPVFGGMAHRAVARESRARYV